MPIKYKIKEKSDNPAEVVFSRIGAVTEVSLGDLDYNIKVNLKRKQELEAQLRIEEATLKNVLQSNPEVEKMDEKQRIAVYIYERSRAMVKVAKEKIEQFEKAIEGDKKEMAEITKQSGIILIKINDVIQK